MTTENQVPSGDIQKPSGPSDQSNQENQNEKVSYDSYKKLLGEKKQRDADLAALKSKLDNLEQEKLKETGNWKQLAEEREKKMRELEQSLKNTHGNFAMRSVTSQLKAEAAKLGCVDDSALVNLYKQDLMGFEIDSEFNVKSDDLTALLSRAQKEKPYLFQKKAPPVNSTLPSSSQNYKGKEIKDMSVEELQTLYRTQGR